MGVKIREKPNGSGEWWIFINHHGKRKSKRVGDLVTAKEVAKKVGAKLVLQQFELNEEEANELPTLKEYSILWLDDYIKPLRRLSTYERYTDILKRHVYPKARLWDPIQSGSVWVQVASA